MAEAQKIYDGIVDLFARGTTSAEVWHFDHLKKLKSVCASVLLFCPFGGTPVQQKIEEKAAPGAAVARHAGTLNPPARRIPLSAKFQELAQAMGDIATFETTP